MKGTLKENGKSEKFDSTKLEGSANLRRRMHNE